MNFEYEIFKRKKVNIAKLIKYGFKEEGILYKYSKQLLKNFRVDLIFSENIMTGKVFDMVSQEEYVNFRIEDMNGEFVSKIREEYKELLKDIATKCFDNNCFISKQANRITNMISSIFHDEPEFLWEKTPGCGVFRNPQNKKWYGIIMNIDKSKIVASEKGEVELLNVKLDDKKIVELLKEKGFYPAYHMNKKYWITIILDETIEDEEIINLVGESHFFTEKC